MDMLEGKKLMSHDHEIHTASKILSNQKVIVYFFSASWVSASELLQTLISVYKENKKRNTGIEIVYVSADNDEKHFVKEFSSHGPWLAIPFKSETSVELRWKYDVTSLPQLIVVRKEDGLIITRKGKEELTDLGFNVLVTWTEYIQQ